MTKEHYFWYLLIWFAVFMQASWFKLHQQNQRNWSITPRRGRRRFYNDILHVSCLLITFLIKGRPHTMSVSYFYKRYVVVPITLFFYNKLDNIGEQNPSSRIVSPIIWDSIKCHRHKTKQSNWQQEANTTQQYH